MAVGFLLGIREMRGSMTAHTGLRQKASLNALRANTMPFGAGVRKEIKEV
jgi:hypothetical protein